MIARNSSEAIIPSQKTLTEGVALTMYDWPDPRYISGIILLRKDAQSRYYVNDIPIASYGSLCEYTTLVCIDGTIYYVLTSEFREVV